MDNEMQSNTPEYQEVELETKYYKLERLVKWPYVDELNQALLSGTMSPKKAAVWCRERGFDISHPKLYEYKDMLQKAISKGITVERMLGIGAPKRTPISMVTLGIINGKEMVKNELQVLDAIIQRGFTALTDNPNIKIQDAMRAIELKNKLTGGNHGGYTMYGLDKLRELETMKMQAMIQVVMKYLPDDKVDELEQALLDAERVYYEEQAPELLDEWKQVHEEYNDDISGD